ncbi:hypothetical protein BT63DRAFT_241299 [Microthyrium microscopicum]|uniref:PNPLA domain-containing protein n=1 Tax=Microthyrium microscopicum TaxID=703497 RepID=A0A6A6UI70_9PEZI|nr:hypothetical protein BT63DRAFT_241299 [Microthyrium microscopicum]
MPDRPEALARQDTWRPKRSSNESEYKYGPESPRFMPSSARTSGSITSSIASAGHAVHRALTNTDSSPIITQLVRSFAREHKDDLMQMKIIKGRKYNLSKQRNVPLAFKLEQIMLKIRLLPLLIEQIPPGEPFDHWRSRDEVSETVAEADIMAMELLEGFKTAFFGPSNQADLLAVRNILAFIEKKDFFGTVKMLHRVMDILMYATLRLEQSLTSPPGSQIPGLELKDCIAQLEELNMVMPQAVTMAKQYSRSKERSDDISDFLCCVSFDGEGSRTYASILIMQAINDRFKQLTFEASNSHDMKTYGDMRASSEWKTEPGQVFDYIFGTGSGAILAVMLGRLQLPLDRCKWMFRTAAPELLANLSRARGEHYLKQYTAESIKLSYGLPHVGHPVSLARQPLFRRRDGQNCTTLVLAPKIDEDKNPIPRTYYWMRDDQGQSDIIPSATSTKRSSWANNALYIYNAVYATCHPDGTTQIGNPEEEAWGEIFRDHRDMEMDQWMIISIGSAPDLPYPIEDPKRKAGLNSLAQTKGLKYFRFDVPGQVSMNEWNVSTVDNQLGTDQWLEMIVQKYLRDPEIQDKIERCARLLWQHRRLK